MTVAADDGFEALQGYDGYEYLFENGFIAKFEIRRVDAQPGTGRPHPYRYSFTLHDPSGKRVLGFDNAHALSKKSGKRRIRSPSADHWHRDEHDKGRPYAFTSPQQLLDDFMKAVEDALTKFGGSTQIQEMRKSP